MRIKDSIKGFTLGVNKIIAPKATFRFALKRMKTVKPAILDKIFEVKRDSRIPQFIFQGTDYYQCVYKSFGANGKGYYKDQALASGIMELAERYSCFRFLSNKHKAKLATFNEMKKGLFQKNYIYTNCIEGLDKHIPLNRKLFDIKIRWFKAYTLRGEEVYLPTALMAPFIQGTNGMAAGNSLEEALLQGICEVIERHCLAIINVNRMNTPLIDMSSVKDDIAKKMIKNFYSLGHKIYIKDFSLGMGIPVIGVVRVIDNKSCFITAGVSTSPSEALIRALAESSQTESESNKVSVKDALHHFIYTRVIKINNINSIENRNIKVELENIEKLLNKQKMEIFFHDTTDRKLKIPSVIVFIKGAKCVITNDFYKKKIKNKINFLYYMLNEISVIENKEKILDYIKEFQVLDRENYPIYEFRKNLIILERQNNYMKEIEYLKEMSDRLHLDDCKQIILIGSGIYYHSKGKIDKAANFYTKAFRINPSFRFEHFDLYQRGMRSDDATFKNLLDKSKTLYDKLKVIGAIERVRSVSLFRKNKLMKVKFS